MTAQTVTGAVAVRQKQDQVVAWIRAQQNDIAMIAASHVKPSAIVRVTQGALRRNDKLMAAAIANPQSLLYALLDAARLGHEPDTDDYYLVPFGNEVQGIEGYKGIIERMYRAGGVSSVVAQVVRQRDHYRPRGENTPPVHEWDDFASPEERGPMRGAYAYAVFPSGQCSQVIRMGRAEIMEHKAKSRGSDRSDSPWQQWEAAMWKKTVLRALEPYVPTSTEYRTAVAGPAYIGTVTPEPGSAPVPVTARQAAELAESGVVLDAEVVEEPRQPAREPENLTGAAPAAATARTDARATGKTAPSGKPSEAATERLAKLIGQIPLGEDHDVTALIAWLTGRADADVIDEQLTAADVKTVTMYLADALEHADSPEIAASNIWAQYHRMHPKDGSDG